MITLTFFLSCSFIKPVVACLNLAFVCSHYPISVNLSSDNLARGFRRKGAGVTIGSQGSGPKQVLRTLSMNTFLLLNVKHHRCFEGGQQLSCFATPLHEVFGGT